MLLCILLDMLYSVKSCTSIGIGRLATVDGSVMIAQSDDGWTNDDARVSIVPRNSDRFHAVYPSPESYPRFVGVDRGTTYMQDLNASRTKPIMLIPQHGTTLSYSESTYAMMNERQVAIAESSCSSVIFAKGCGSETDRHDGNCAVMSIDELSRIALQRATTARNAILIMGRLSEEYGFYGPTPAEKEGGESLIVGDTLEAWIFHILPSDFNGSSAIWVAERIDDRAVAVVANMFTIRVIDPQDTARFLGNWKLMYSTAHTLNCSTYPLDFTRCFSAGEYSHKYSSGRRMWRVLDLLTNSQVHDEYGDLKLDVVPPYPATAPVSQTVSLKDMFSIYRDWFSGTKYDLTHGPAAGPFGSPIRYEGSPTGDSHFWERSINLIRTTSWRVSVMRSWLPDNIGGIVWYATNAAHASVMMPIPAGTKILPAGLTSGNPRVYDKHSSYWATQFISNFMHLMFSYMLDDVRSAQSVWETRGIELVKELENDMTDMDLKVANHITETIVAWHELGEYLVTNYAGGFVKEEAVGYPEWWLNDVGYNRQSVLVENT